MTDRFNVMISSTRQDLPVHRDQAKAAVEQWGGHPLGMETLPASPDDAITASLKLVDEAQVYVGIFAHRYGFVPDSPCNPDRLSITEMEYRHAVERHLPRLIFIIDPAHPLLADSVETGEGADRLQKLIAQLKLEYVVAFFKSPEDLRGHVLHALHQLKLLPDRSSLWMPAPLPLPGELPPPGSLPSGSRTLVGRNPNFTGREDDLRALADLLLHAPDGAKAVITPAAAATGSGGIGKTQLAVEFAHRYGRCFYGVHWLGMYGARGADVISRFEAEIAACGAALGLPDFPDKQPDQVAVTLKLWAQTPPRLVIFDNAEDPQAVQDVLPRLAGARLLVTSRWNEGQDWQAIGVTCCGLDVLTRAQSIDLLTKLAPNLTPAASPTPSPSPRRFAGGEGSKSAPPDSLPPLAGEGPGIGAEGEGPGVRADPELDALAARLGDFPLALDLAGRYLHALRRTGLTPAEYRQRLDASASALDHSSLRGWAAQAHQTNPTRHDTDVAATFDLSWQKVDDLLARDLFKMCGYLAPSRAIPPDLLLALAGGQDEALALALGQLVGYGLLAPDPHDRDALIVHPLLADFARMALTPLSPLHAVERGSQPEAGPGEVNALARAADALARLSRVALDTGLPAQFAPLRPHVAAAAERVEAAGLDGAGTLWNNLGYHLRMTADLAGARTAFERALRLDEAAFGPDHPNVALRVSNLGNVLHDLGDLAGARAACERALHIGEVVYGSDHPQVAIYVNNLGSVLQGLGDLAGARTAFERALRLDEAVFGPDHPNIARDVNNLGSVLHDLGDLAGARAAFERVLGILEKMLPPNHPYIAATTNNLGLVLKDLGDLAGARVAFERALRIDEAVFGPDHPEVATDVNNLGSMLYDLGDLAGARAAFERALRLFEQFLPPGHPKIETVRHWLAVLGGEE